MTKIKSIGIIAEDNSDFETSKVLISRIIKKDNIKFKKAIGNGCAKVKSKALTYSKVLKNRGCNLLILIHDLDRNNLQTLNTELDRKLKDCPIKDYFVCIPIEEIEAWLLSDPAGIKEALNLRKAPNVQGNPETIKSPKERLEKYVETYSNHEKDYNNVKDNEKIAAKICIDKVKAKCNSFKLLHDFLLSHTY
ncbi:MAG: hypothetical protein A2X12_10230 [Bacteroidetes bacterium GWE2_29_8]|nr:MAG: hypothetical protein A2X12_10230 [Bacteroidetes bacterium GWE2_29_8]OFY18999.1 MAG: hypothetical protein A2X02_03415 [Bacteroidetes bacterium GWF2_29_10]